MKCGGPLLRFLGLSVLTAALGSFGISDAFAQGQAENPSDFSQALVLALLQSDETLKESRLTWKSSEAISDEGSKPYSLRAYSNAFKPDYEGFADRSNFQYTLGAEGQLPYGLSLETEYTEVFQEDAEPEVQINSSLNLWPNLVGRVDRMSASRVGLREGAARLRFQEQKARVCLASYASYLDWVQAQSAFQVSSESFRLSQEVFRELRKQFKRKQIRELEFRSAEVDLEQARLDLAEAQLSLDQLSSELKSRISGNSELVFPQLFDRRKLQKDFERLYSFFEASSSLASAGQQRDSPSSEDTQLLPAQLQQQARRLEANAAELAWKQESLAFGPQLSAFYRYKDGDFGSLVSRETSVGVSVEWRFWDSGHRAQSVAESFEEKKRQLQMDALVRKQMLEEKIDKLSLEKKPARLAALRKQLQLQRDQLRLARQDLEFGRIAMDVYINYRNATDAAELKYVRELSAAFEDLLKWRLLFSENNLQLDSDESFCRFDALVQQRSP